MATTPKQTTNTQETNETPKVGAEGVETSKQETQSETKNILEEAEKKQKEYEGIYGKNPSKEEIVTRFQKENPEKYKDKSYEDILDILENDKDLKHPELRTRLKKNIDKPKTETAKPAPTEIASEPQATKTEEIQKKKDELFKPEPAPVEKKATEQSEGVPQGGKEKPKKASSRWTEKDEASRTGSQNVAKQEKQPEEAKDKGKKETHFWKGVGKTILWPFKTLNKVRRTAGRTLMAPSYFLADIGEKKKTGGADLAKGYKEIWTGKKAA